MKITRIKLIATSVAAMLVLAGCATQSSTPLPVAAGDDSNPTASQTTGTIGQCVSLEDVANKSKPGGANLSQRSQLQAEQLMTSFYENLPEDDSERRKVGLEAAQATCNVYQNISNEADLETAQKGGNLSKDIARRIAYSTQIANEQYTDSIPTHSAESLRQITDDATKYVPLVTSYRSMSECACDAVETNTTEDLREFYTSALVFGVDTILVSTGAFYQPAFRATGFVTNKASQVGLYRLRYITGDRGWALAMSEVHWAVRGEMTESAGQIVGQATEIGVNLSKSGVDWEFVAQAQGTNKSVVTSGVPSSTLPKDTSWSLESENGTRTINVTIGNYTDTVSVPSEANANSYTEYTREYANLSELKPTTTALLNQTSNLTGISEDRLNSSIGNAGGTIQDNVDDGVKEVEDTAECASNSSQESEGGFLDKAKDVVDDCNPVNGDDNNDDGDLL
jgi:hypothetical protein